MLSLRELQAAFGAALLARDDARAQARDAAALRALEPHIDANGLEPGARLRIYRNNARENFANALRATYPVLGKLVGEDYFRQLAAEYRAAHPSRSGDLRHVGAALPGFLERRFGTGDYAYFPDVARLEWAVQEAFVAPEHARLDLDRLASVDPVLYAELRFALHPAARLVTSPFPILAIWRANQDGADPGLRIDLDAGAEHVLVTRAGDDVELVALPLAEFEFLARCAAATPFGEAVAAAAAHGAFDAGASLRRHVTAGTVVDFHVPQGEST